MSKSTNNHAGWVPLHKCFADSSIGTNPSAGWLYVHLLMKASYKDDTISIGNEEILVRKGSVITGRKQMCLWSGLSEQSVRTALKYLKSTDRIEMSSTNKFSVIRIVNWDKYQVSRCEKYNENDTVELRGVTSTFDTLETSKTQKTPKSNHQTNQQSNHQDNHQENDSCNQQANHQDSQLSNQQNNDEIKHDYTSNIIDTNHQDTYTCNQQDNHQDNDGFNQQDNQQTNQLSNQRLTSKQPANNQQPNHYYKNNKKIINNKKQLRHEKKAHEKKTTSNTLKTQPFLEESLLSSSLYVLKIFKEPEFQTEDGLIKYLRKHRYAVDIVSDIYSRGKNFFNGSTNCVSDMSLYTRSVGRGILGKINGSGEYDLLSVISVSRRYAEKIKRDHDEKLECEKLELEEKEKSEEQDVENKRAMAAFEGLPRGRREAVIGSCLKNLQANPFFSNKNISVDTWQESPFFKAEVQNYIKENILEKETNSVV